MFKCSSSSLYDDFCLETKSDRNRDWISERNWSPSPSGRASKCLAKDAIIWRESYNRELLRVSNWNKQRVKFTFSKQVKLESLRNNLSIWTLLHNQNKLFREKLQHNPQSNHPLAAGNYSTDYHWPVCLSVLLDDPLSPPHGLLPVRRILWWQKVESVRELCGETQRERDRKRERKKLSWRIETESLTSIVSLIARPLDLDCFDVFESCLTGCECVFHILFWLEGSWLSFTNKQVIWEWVEGLAGSYGLTIIPMKGAPPREK